jgi:protein-L-isoaspartate(D-aspartate) O-methyltransferase
MMKTKHKICVSFLALVFISLNYSMSQDLKADKYFNQRRSMVEHQIKGRGISNKNVLNALMSVPRHKFVPVEYQSYAYDDRPLPIGFDQTISQPYIVAYMTEILNPGKSEKVLEIGTGSGYQAAILSLLYKNVYTVEIIEALGNKAKKVFNEEGYNNIKVKIGDGYQGWKEYAPFNAIIVTCAPTNIPQPLVEQLAEGGKMIIPVGADYNQALYLLEKRNGKIHKTKTLPVLFVPMMREK